MLVRTRLKFQLRELYLPAKLIGGTVNADDEVSAVVFMATQRLQVIAN
jgi:hypothetical protein